MLFQTSGCFFCVILLGILRIDFLWVLNAGFLFLKIMFSS